MDGIHDMGGMAGFGPVDADAVGPTDAPWEARVQAVALLGSDGLRAAIEALDPAEYLRAGYYERWLLSAERRCVESGRVSPDDLRRWRSALADPDVEPPQVTSPHGTDGLVEILTTTSPMAPASEARLGVGDRVRVRRMRPEGHHRCPRYVRGAVGVVERVAGEEHVPAAAPGEPPGPLEAVYTVRFDSTDLWGTDGDDDREDSFEVLVDLWEHYLEAA